MAFEVGPIARVVLQMGGNLMAHMTVWPGGGKGGMRQVLENGHFTAFGEPGNGAFWHDNRCSMFVEATIRENGGGGLRV